MSGESMIKELIYQFSEADSHRLFNFTSGHLGAIPISDRRIVGLLEIKQYINVSILGLLLDIAKHVILLLLPVKNIGLLTRTALRKVSNPEPPYLSSLTVLSLGNQSADKDAYFGVLLKNIGTYNYIKIVGGFGFKNAGYVFIESCLSYIKLTKLTILAAISPIACFGYLLVSSKHLSLEKRLIYIFCGLKEINGGVAFGNKVIIESLASHIETSEVKKLLFPMEGRNWEKNITAELNVKKIDSIGYLHCALTPRHLSLINPLFYKKEEQPCTIVVPGEMAFNIIHKCFPATTVRQGFFLRGDSETLNSGSTDRGMLLFALTGNIDESEQVMRYVASSNLQEKYKVVVRLNPNTSSYNHLCKFAKALGINTFSAEIDEVPKLCFFRSSSVALDYLKSDVVPVYLSIGEIVSNNIFELDNKYQFESIRVGNQLNEDVESLLSRLKPYQINGREAANYYLDQRVDLNQLAGLIV